MPDITGGDGREQASPEAPTLEELEVLHTSLNADEREELLECLLIAATNGADAMMRALSPWLLAAAARELLHDHDVEGLD